MTSQQQCLLNDERLRISRDIHDNLGARLTEMILLSDLAQKNKTKADEVDAHVGNISKIAREVIRDLDAIVWAVNPKNDFVDNFATYIFQYVERFLGITSIRFRLDLPDGLPHSPLTSEIRHNLFLVAKEALNNIVKHSGASEVRVRLRMKNALLTLEIDDNGKGFQTTAQRRGNGLANMENRVCDVGGRLELVSQTGRGTRLHIQIKLPGSQQIADSRTGETILQAA
jgi:signal transduction histidine kinase